MANIICELCNKTYCSIVSLTNHKRNYHTNLVYKCIICNNKKYNKNHNK